MRAERARLMGYESFAAYKLADTMAKTPEAALELLRNVWTPAVARAGRERDALQELVREEGGNFALAPWDWRYYAEKLRRREHDLDEAEIKPYLQLERVVEAAFDTAGRLFGLDFAEIRDAPRYHPDVRIWEVTRDGRACRAVPRRLFRPALEAQRRLDELLPDPGEARRRDPADHRQRLELREERSRPSSASTTPAPCSTSSATRCTGCCPTSPTRFSPAPRCRPTSSSCRRSSTSTGSKQPQVLRRFALHYRTGEPMPEALLQRVLAARTFNQGFATVEYTSSALVDMDLHQLGSAEDLDVGAFEKAALARIGMPREIVMRHRTPHFSHIFSGDGYSAGYYSYLWSEVLDADAFDAFREAGDIFDRDTARKLHDFIYAAGNRRPPDDAYRAFRGRMPSIQALLKKRGLAEAPTDARAGV